MWMSLMVRSWVRWRLVQWRTSWMVAVVPSGVRRVWPGVRSPAFAQPWFSCTQNGWVVDVRVVVLPSAVMVRSTKSCRLPW